MATATKKRKEKKKFTLGKLALLAGTQQTLSNLFWDFRYLWKNNGTNYISLFITVATCGMSFYLWFESSLPDSCGAFKSEVFEDTLRASCGFVEHIDISLI